MSYLWINLKTNLPKYKLRKEFMKRRLGISKWVLKIDLSIISHKIPAFIKMNMNMFMFFFHFTKVNINISSPNKQSSLKINIP